MAAKSAGALCLLTVVVVAALAAEATKVSTRKPLLRALFDDVLDGDGNGVLSALEMAKFTQRIESKATEAHAKPFVAMVDGNDDGVLSWAEFSERFARLDGERYLNSTAPEQVHLAFGTTATTMTVQWATFASTATVVQYGTASGSYTNRATGFQYTYTPGLPPWDGFLHKVYLQDLVPNTRYYYRVGNDVDWSPEFSFTSAVPAGIETDVSYLIYGDMGTFMLFGFLVTDEIVKIQQREKYALTWHLGDISYAGGGVLGYDQELSVIWDIFNRQVEPMAAAYPYMTVVGNHESSYNFTAFNARFEMPGRESGGENYFYSFDHGLVHFVATCSESYAAPFTPGTPHYEWMRQDLAKAAANRGRVPWIVVGGHRPMYGTSEAGNWENIRVNLEPLLIEYKVDLFLAGHIHAYERTHAVADYVVTDRPDANEVYRNPSAPIHVTIGTAGAIVNDRWEEETDFIARRLRNYGFSDMKVSRTMLTYTFRSGQSGPDWPEGNDGRGVSDVFYIVKGAR